MFNPQCHTGPPLRSVPVIGAKVQISKENTKCFGDFLSKKDFIEHFVAMPNTPPKSSKRALYKGSVGLA
jgi:hypothetical protein